MISSRTDAAPPSAPAERIAALDGLRGLAIALVLWQHLVTDYLPGVRQSWLGWVRAATNLSWCGVDLFFVLSGFFIGGILLDRRESPRLARVFYARRACRILPLYYLAVAAALFTAARAALPAAAPLFSPWVYLAFCTNFGLAWVQSWDWLPLSVLWSLAVEEQFYLLAPWIVRWTPVACFPLLAGSLAGVAWILRWALLAWRPQGHFGAQTLMPWRMDTLALGALVAWGMRARSAPRLFGWLFRRWPVWLGLAALPVAVLALRWPRPGAPALCLWGYGALAIFFAGLVAVAAGTRPPRLTRALAWAPLAHLGRHSYFIYLWHPLIGLAVINRLGGQRFSLHTPAGAGIVALAAGLTWLAAALSMRFFEGPLLALGQRWKY